MYLKIYAVNEKKKIAFRIGQTGIIRNSIEPQLELKLNKLEANFKIIIKVLDHNGIWRYTLLGTVLVCTNLFSF